VTALSSLSAPLATALALLMMAAVIALVAWALQLMQSANDSREFSLMLAGCMVCSAAVGLATVMVLTFTSPERVHARDLADRPDQTAGISLDAIVLPWDPPPQRPSLAPR
jgi:NADH:ubiquinone oxidoreductase subunit K